MKTQIRSLVTPLAVASALWLTTPAAQAQTGPGYALSFNRAFNQSVTVPGFGNVAPTTEITIEFWQKVDSATQSQTTFAMNTAGNGINGYVPWSDGKVYWNFGNNASSLSYLPPVSLVGTWHHFAFVASQSGNYMKIFRNGVEEATQAGMTPFTPANVNLLIGYNGSWSWGGELDEIRVWNVARSENQIKAFRYARINGSASNLVAYWRFDEGNGTTAADATVPAENGALTGGPVWVPSGIPQPGSGVTGPVVTTLAASSVNATGPGATTATLNASVNPGADFTAVYFQWGTNNHYGNTTPATTLNAGAGLTSVAHSLTGLVAGVAYHFRVVTANNLGLAYGADRVFGGPIISLFGPAALTNECQIGFVDQGVSIKDPVSTVAILAGRYHSLVLKGDGTVAGWGYNYNGEITDVPNTVSPYFFSGPVVLSGQTLSGVVAIGGGDYHTFALRTNGSIVSWGANSFGQSSVPPSATNMVAFAGGNAHSLALRADGTVVAWGSNTYGQTNVPPSATNVVAISGGNAHSLALRADGTVVAWGAGTNNTGIFPAYGQSIVPASATNVVAVAAGAAHSLALQANGTVLAWGAGTNSAYTNPSYGQSVIPANATNVVAIAAGDYHSLALRADGTVLVWGARDYGQTNVPPSVTNVMAIAGGWAHCLAMRADGSVVAWGAGTNATGGIPIYGQSIVPPSATQLEAVAAGYYHSLALRSNGTVVAWGNNSSRQIMVPHGLSGVKAIAGGSDHTLLLLTNGTLLGLGDSVSAVIPPGLNGVAAIAASYYHNLALTTNGMVVPWGTGAGTNMPAGLSGVVAVAAGFDHSLALKSDGKVVAWGSGAATNVPAGLSGVVAIAAGQFHSLALKSDGKVVAWGNGSASQTNVPTSLSGVVAIAAGGDQCLALKSDGSVLLWGAYYSGFVPPVGGVVKIAAGYNHSLALKSDGTVYMWGVNSGANNFGQMTQPGFGEFSGVTTRMEDWYPGYPPGNYTRTYTAVTPPGAQASITHSLVVAPGTAPIVSTQPATGISPTGATFEGYAIPRDLMTVAWFEWGTTTNYTVSTPAQAIGSGTDWVPVNVALSGLAAPGVPIHYRLVAQNCVSTTYGTDETFVLPQYPSPGLTAPIANQLILPGQTNTIPLSLLNGHIVSVFSSNPALVPNSPANLILTGSGSSRTLQVVPMPGQSGETLITVTVSDGEQTSTSTFFVSVPPADGDFSPLRFTDFEHTWQQFPTQSMRLVFSDDGFATAATTNLVLEFKPGLGSAWSGAQNTVITNLGGGNYEATVTGQTNDTGFFRLRGVRLVTSSLGADGLSADGNPGTNLLTLTFNAPLQGWVSYTVSQVGQPIITNMVYVNGTTALIEVPVGANPEPGTLRNFTVTLAGGGAGYQILNGFQSTFNVEDEDSEWQGTFSSGDALFGFVMKLQKTAGIITQGTLYSAGYGLFPTNAQPVSVTYWSNWFSAAALELPLPTNSTTLNHPTLLTLRLTATNGPGVTNVTATRLSGPASVILRTPTLPVLNTTNLGSFVLLKVPPRPSTNQVNLFN